MTAHLILPQRRASEHSLQGQLVYLAAGKPIFDLDPETFELTERTHEPKNVAAAAVGRNI